jgi:hypothetical protein
MHEALRAIILGAVLVLGMPTVASATEIDGVNVTSADVSQLLAALHTALKPNDSTIPIVVTLKSSGQMPSYAKQWYYAGIREKPGARTMNVWINSDLKDANQQQAITASFLLALADGGYGGQTFKQLYDASAAKDAQLPPDAANPFLNRQALAAKLVDLTQL